MFELLSSYDEAIVSTNNLIRTLRAYPTLLDEKENLYMHQFFDKCLFTALNQLDLIIGLKYLDISNAMKNQIEANYFSRIVAHTSFEILNDLNKLAGKQIREFVLSNCTKEVLSDIDTAIRELNIIKKEKLKILKEIRNNLFGHKHANAFSQTVGMLKIQNSEIYAIGNDIFKMQIQLLFSYQNMMMKI